MINPALWRVMPCSLVVILRYFVGPLLAPASRERNIKNMYEENNFFYLEGGVGKLL
jgi:hypothetical protein